LDLEDARRKYDCQYFFQLMELGFVRLKSNLDCFGRPAHSLQTKAASLKLCFLYSEMPLPPYLVKGVNGRNPQAERWECRGRGERGPAVAWC